jgi:hypothetical protein
MKTANRSLLLIAAISAVSVWPALASEPTETSPASEGDKDKGKKLFGLVDTENIKIDLKSIDADKGYFGIDYQFSFIKSLVRSDTQRWDISFRGNGFLTADSAKNDIDSLTTEAAATFFPLWRPATEVTPTPDGVAKTREFFKGPGGFDPGLVERVQGRAEKLYAPITFYADAHVKHETTQDFRDYDFALGASMAVTTSYLEPILDAPFKLLRFGPEGKNNGPRQVDLSVAYDYVTARHTSQPTSADDDVNRLSARAEWETGIFRSDRVSFVVTANYHLDGPAESDGLHPFFLAKYEHLLVDAPHAKTSFAIKYTAGELPPNFVTGHIIGAGFAIEF